MKPDRCEGCPIDSCPRLRMAPDGSMCRSYLAARGGRQADFLPPPSAPAVKTWELPAFRANKLRIARCSHRRRLPKDQQSSCGCKYGCTAPHPRRWPDGAIDDLACFDCTKERVRVAFWGPIFSRIGGTETWHSQAAKWFDPLKIDILGYGVGRVEDPEIARERFAPYPVAAGVEASVRLAMDAEVVIAWGGEPAWRSMLPPDWPGKLVAVCHGDASSLFAVNTMREAQPFADAMAAVSAPALEAIPEGRREGAWLIPNALELPEGPPAWDRARGASPRRIGYLGRYTREKRPELVARAARHLPAGFEVELCGPPPEWLAQTLIDDLGPPPAVPARALGDQGPEGVRAFLRGLGALVVPSENEGFGYSIGEAWAAGVPVLATPRGLAETHPECVTLLSPDPTPAEIARAAEGLWVDPERTADQVERARAVVRESYSPQAWARAWEDRIIALARG